MNANVLVLKKGFSPFLSQRKTIREHFALSFTQTYVLALFVIGVLGVFYVFLLNTNATKGYAVRNLEIAHRDLATNKNLLDIRIAEGQSLESLTTNPSTKVMETIAEPQFLVVSDAFYTFADNTKSTASNN